MRTSEETATTELNQAVYLIIYIVVMDPLVMDLINTKGIFIINSRG